MSIRKPTEIPLPSYQLCSILKGIRVLVSLQFFWWEKDIQILPLSKPTRPRLEDVMQDSRRIWLVFHVGLFFSKVVDKHLPGHVYRWLFGGTVLRLMESLFVFASTELIIFLSLFLNKIWVTEWIIRTYRLQGLEAQVSHLSWSYWSPKCAANTGVGVDMSSYCLYNGPMVQLRSAKSKPYLLATGLFALTSIDKRRIFGAQTSSSG